jgi:hypothetical protein
MREVIRESLDYYYKEVFSELTNYIRTLENIEFYITMNSGLTPRNDHIKIENLIGFNAVCKAQN